jgi:hypothetical protein
VDEEDLKAAIIRAGEDGGVSRVGESFARRSPLRSRRPVKAFGFVAPFLALTESTRFRPLGLAMMRPSGLARWSR